MGAQIRGIRRKVSFDEAVNFTRASVKGVFGGNRLFHERAANERAMAFDPATGEAKGIRIDPQVTHDLLWNRDLGNAVWDTTGATVTQNQVGLDGVGNKGWSITGDDATQSKSITDNSATHTVIAHWKKTSADARLSMQMTGGTTTLNYQADLDVSAGTVTAGGDAVASQVSVVDRGEYYLVEINAPNNGTGNTTLIYGIRPVTLTETAIYDYGSIQLNRSFALMPIEVEGSALVVAADDATRTLGDEFNKSTFSVVSKFRFANAAPLSVETRKTVFTLSDGTINNSLGVDWSEINTFRLRYVVGTGEQISTLIDNPTPGTTHMLVLTYYNGLISAAIDGTEVLTEVDAGSEDPISVVSRIDIGTTIGARHWGSNIEFITLHSEAFSQSERESRSTL